MGLLRPHRIDGALPEEVCDLHSFQASEVWKRAEIGGQVNDSPKETPLTEENTSLIQSKL